MMNDRGLDIAARHARVLAAAGHSIAIIDHYSVSFYHGVGESSSLRSLDDRTLDALPR